MKKIMRYAFLILSVTLITMVTIVMPVMAGYVPVLSLTKEISDSAIGPWSSSINVVTDNSVYYKFTIFNNGNVIFYSPIGINDPDVSTAGCTWPDILAQDFNHDPPSTTCVVGPVTVLEGLHTNTATAFAGYENPNYLGPDYTGPEYPSRMATYYSEPSSASYTGRSIPQPPVPELPTIALMGLGVLGLLFMSKRIK